MRVWLAFCLAFLTSTAPAAERFLDGTSLYEGLERDDPSASAYILGVYDALQIVQYHMASSERFFCIPVGVTDEEIAAAVRNLLASASEIRFYPAAILVLRGFIESFPCGET